MAHPDTLYVIAAAYDDVDAAVADYEAVKALYHEVKTSHDFDAAVIAKDDEGKVSIVKKHEQPTRHGAAVGLGWGPRGGGDGDAVPAGGHRPGHWRYRSGGRRGHRRRGGPRQRRQSPLRPQGPR